jgi:hypothetical protein
MIKAVPVLVAGRDVQRCGAVPGPEVSAAAKRLTSATSPMSRAAPDGPIPRRSCRRLSVASSFVTANEAPKLPAWNAP